MDNKEFFCPLYDGNITQYDCDEITCGLKLGYYINDGLEPLVPLHIAKSKAHLCYSCERNPNSCEKICNEQNTQTEATTHKKMSEDEIRKRLSGRAMEYLMFLDDED